MAENVVPIATLPEASSLVQRARERLAAELAEAPPWGSPLLTARLRVTARPQPISLGALSHYLRMAVRRQDMQAARDLFTTLLTRIEGLAAPWSARVVGRTPHLNGEAGEGVREDLRQELALALWRQIGLGDGEAFELFFVRALRYTQQHVATAFMSQRGYWTLGAARPSEHVLTLALSQLAPRDDDGEEREAPPLADASDAFTAADLADLRAMVLGLPIRERMTVVMRFWQLAPEAEIATSLGVTTRTVRTYLQNAYETLRVAYAGGGGGA